MNNKAINGIKYWGQLLLLPVYWLSFIVPRNKNIWLFGSTFGRRFADNPRYLYLYVSQQEKQNGIRPIWISHKKEIIELLKKEGYEAYYYHSLKGIWYCLRGKVYIFDNYSKDISFWLSGGAKKINLWHGVGNKKINYDNKFDKVRHPQNMRERCKTFPRRLSDEKPHHYILATSPMMADIFEGAFQVKPGHVITGGYPRNDMLLSSEINNIYTQEEKNNINYIKAIKAEGYILDLYMPTFRESETKFFEVMDMEKFNEFLCERKIIFLTKLHPKSKLKSEFERQNFSNIRNISSDVDPYSFLKEADILTTDYSSIYSDYMLLDRPVVGFPYDYETYSKETREEYFAFEEYMPELQAHTMNELMQYTTEVLNKDINRKQRQESRKRMFSYKDGEASKRIVRQIRCIINM